VVLTYSAKLNTSLGTYCNAIVLVGLVGGEEDSSPDRFSWTDSPNRSPRPTSTRSLLHDPTTPPATNSTTRHNCKGIHTYFLFLHPTTPTIDMLNPGPNMGSGSPKDGSLRFRTTLSNALTDQLPSLIYSRASPFRSLSPLRTQEEQREALASILREAMSIIESEIDDGSYEDDDDSAGDDDGNTSRGASSNSSNYRDRNQ
jgi:hypothetical protein